MSWNVESKPLFPGRDTPGECSPVLCSSSSFRTTSWRPSVEVSTIICHMETEEQKKNSLQHSIMKSQYSFLESWHKRIGRILFWDGTLFKQNAFSIGIWIMFASSPPSHLHVVFELLEEMHAEPHHQPSTTDWIGLSGGLLSVGRFPKLIVLLERGKP